MNGKKLTTEEFIYRSKLLHGDKYNYDKTIYINSGKHLIVSCPKHGDFKIRPDMHLYNRGCKKCGNKMISNDEFIIQSNLVHKNKYDYSKTIFLKKDEKVIITCPNHGDFKQTPTKHLSGQGCSKCVGKNMSLSEFINKSNIIHNNRYEYKLINNIKTKKDIVQIICAKHGIFTSTVSLHLKKSGCPNCGFNTSLAGDEFIKSFNNDNIIKEKILFIDGKRFKVDGYDETTKTIYEYFGTFWHGHPDRKDLVGIHPFYKLPYTEIYQKTLNRINIFENNGYNVIYKWGR